MKCEEAREIINLLLDGEEDRRAEEAQSHIDNCAECMEWHRSFQSAMLALEEMKECIPDVDFADLIIARLPEKRKQRLWFPSVKWPVYVAASWLVGFAILASIIFYVTTSFTFNVSQFCSVLQTHMGYAMGVAGSFLRSVGAICETAYKSEIVRTLFAGCLLFDLVAFAGFAYLFRLRKRTGLTIGLMT
jgi:predicted anti-sigma-YlaC factor YlaD